MIYRLLISELVGVCRDTIGLQDGSRMARRSKSKISRLHLCRKSAACSELVDIQISLSTGESILFAIVIFR